MLAPALVPVTLVLTGIHVLAPGLEPNTVVLTPVRESRVISFVLVPVAPILTDVCITAPVSEPTTFSGPGVRVKSACLGSGAPHNVLVPSLVWEPRVLAWSLVPAALIFPVPVSQPQDQSPSYLFRPWFEGQECLL